MPRITITETHLYCVCVLQHSTIFSFPHLFHIHTHLFHVYTHKRVSIIYIYKKYFLHQSHTYEVPTISRLLIIIGLFCRICLFYRILLRKRPIILRSLRIVATPHHFPIAHHFHQSHTYPFPLVCIAFISSPPPAPTPFVSLYYLHSLQTEYTEYVYNENYTHSVNTSILLSTRLYTLCTLSPASIM